VVVGRDVSADARAEYDRRIAEQEHRVEDDLATIRLVEEHWERYRQVMRELSERFEEIGGAGLSGNRFTRREVAAVREIGAYAGQLAMVQAEERDEIVRKRRAEAEVEVEQLMRERNGLPWE